MTDDGDRADQSDQNREMGVEFGDLRERLEAHEYPATGDELVAAHGEETVRLSDGEASFAELLEVYEDQEFESAHEVETAVLNMVGDDAVGRDRYSDRGGSDPSIDQEDDSA